MMKEKRKRKIEREKKEKSHGEMRGEEGALCKNKMKYNLSR